MKIKFCVSSRGVPHTVIEGDDGEAVSVQYFSKKQGPMYRIFNWYNQDVIGDVHLGKGEGFELLSYLKGIKDNE